MTGGSTMPARNDRMISELYLSPDQMAAFRSEQFSACQIDLLDRTRSIEDNIANRSEVVEIAAVVK